MNPNYNTEVPDASYFERQVLCRTGCPVNTDAGGYVQAIAEGRDEDAYIIARRPNPFASICGRVCAAPCEAKCRRKDIDAAVAIRALKRFVCEQFGVESERFDVNRVYAATQRAERAKLGLGRRVAVVGAGPAGMACAHDLALMGFNVTVFEAQSMAGGMLTLGIPQYRLPREIIQAEIQAIVSLGVDLKLNSRLGRDYSLASLKQDGFEAIFLAIGAHKSRELNIEGVELDGTFRAIDYLLNINLGYRVNLHGKVVVIGGGNVAFDVARSVVRQAAHIDDMSPEALRKILREATTTLDQLTRGEREGPEDLKVALDVARQALRAGVREVHMYCLESLAEMPATKAEIDEAVEEGVKLHTRWGPKRILGKDGRVSGIELIKVASVFDQNRRFNPTFLEGTEETVAADGVVLAIGQAADLSWVRPEDNLKTTARGTVEANPQTLATSRPDVFAGGDLAFGPRIIITAVAEGRRAARSIATFLTGKAPTESATVRTTIYNAHRMFPGYERLPRRQPPAIAIERRVGIAEVENTFPQPEAWLQANRCLKCHVSPVFDGDLCVLCGGCVDVCPESCLRIVDVANLMGDEMLAAAITARYGRMPTSGMSAAIIKDETACIRCGLCAARCPTHAITMERVERLQLA
ncbi:MAG: FAD-dependent oxidoreductase [Verrucomicrobia bacterium]|nr:FAD-dependent oxidoreductase [Verrucomicrobiota bacterium]